MYVNRYIKFTKLIMYQLTSPQNEQPYRSRLESIISVSGKPEERVHEGIASADLQNPSDALEILARVADRADDDNTSSRSDQTPSTTRELRPTPLRQIISPPRMDGYWHYKPIQNGLITPEEVYSLVARSAIPPSIRLSLTIL